MPSMARHHVPRCFIQKRCHEKLQTFPSLEKAEDSVDLIRFAFKANSLPIVSIAGNLLRYAFISSKRVTNF